MAAVGARVKRMVLGRPIASAKAEHHLLPKRLALPVFSSDPLSSVAYATEEMMLILVLGGAAALSLMLPIGGVIALVLLVVVTSYRQTVRAYPNGGGSYIVARENLGTIPGLTAGGAILIGYVVTASVSATAGAVAVTSAIPELLDHKITLSVGFIALIAVANLRGAKEAGRIFAIPTYGFVASVYATLVTGIVRCLEGCPRAETADVPLEPEAAVGLFLVLLAFTSGSSALTGVEAIADGVQAFRRPRARNAAATLGVMAAMSVTMFLGVTFLARTLEVRVTEEIAASRSVLSQIGETVFGRTPGFFLLQTFTALILIVAANTAYQDFPRLSAILARDRFMPRQFRNRGDRLVFSNGIVVLSVLSAILVVALRGNLTRLIALYLVGVFTAFTLSQAGMVRRWVMRRDPGWRRNAVINGIGATTTGVVLVVVVLTKFTAGAWIVIVTLPVIVAGLMAVSRHYERVHGQLRERGLSARMEGQNTMILLVPDLELPTREAIRWLRGVRPDRVIPLYTGTEPMEEVRGRWAELAPRLGDLEPLEVQGDRVVRAVRRYVRGIDRTPDDFVTVVVPEVITMRTLVQFFVFRRRRTAFLLKAGLLFEPRVVVVDIPLLPEEEALATEHADRWERPLEPERNVCLVPVSAVHDGTVRALVYAKSLKPAATEAIFFVDDPEETGAEVLRDWRDPAREIDVPLSLVEAPFRDYGTPMLAEVRRHTSRPDTIVTVVLPEFVLRRWWHHALHNQTALFFKRMLLFEPRVVVVSVPVHLGRREARAEAAPELAPG